MKYEMKIGDKVRVTGGKEAGKEAAILFIDKKNNRVRLDGLKQKKVKTKKGDSKDLHGTYHTSHLQLIKPEAPKEEVKEVAAPAEAAAEKTEEPKAEA